MPKNKPIRDDGHENLMKDLRQLLDEAFNKNFHDFEGDKYATPKVALAGIFNELRDNVINGRYDN